MNARLDIVSIGEILIDFVAPDAPDLLNAEAFARAAGGAPANVAVAAARLGAHTAFFGAVGPDPFGDYLFQVLDENGVDTSGLQRADMQTTLAFVAKNLGGIPDYVFYRGADTRIRADRLPHSILEQAMCVHFSSLPLIFEPARSTILDVAEAADRAGALISLDPTLRPSAWSSTEDAVAAVQPLLERATILKVNEEEAALLTGSTDIVTAMRLLRRSDRLVVVTVGGDGALWQWGDDTGEAPAPAVEVVDTTGAGDSFVGAMLAELARLKFDRHNLASLSASVVGEIVRFAAAAGAATCRKPGAMPSLPTRQEVEQLLA